MAKIGGLRARKHHNFVMRLSDAVTKARPGDTIIANELAGTVEIADTSYPKESCEHLFTWAWCASCRWDLLIRDILRDAKVEVLA